MKQTAVEWLIGRFHYEGFIGTYCSEEQIKSKREMMIEIIEQAKLIEIDQMRAIYAMTWMNRDFDFEQYIKDNKNNVTTK